MERYKNTLPFEEIKTQVRYGVKREEVIYLTLLQDHKRIWYQVIRGEYTSKLFLAMRAVVVVLLQVTHQELTIHKFAFFGARY